MFTSTFRPFPVQDGGEPVATIARRSSTALPYLCEVQGQTHQRSRPSLHPPEKHQESIEKHQTIVGLGNRCRNGAVVSAGVVTTGVALRCLHVRRRHARRAATMGAQRRRLGCVGRCVQRVATTRDVVTTAVFADAHGRQESVSGRPAARGTQQTHLGVHRAASDSVTQQHD